MDVTVPPRIGSRHTKIIGGMAYVIKKPQENHLVCFGGWVPFGGLHKAIEEGNVLPSTKGSLEVVTLAQMGLFAATSTGKKSSKS